MKRRIRIFISLFLVLSVCFGVTITSYAVENDLLASTNTSEALVEALREIEMQKER